jgi:hypothetical protein
MADNIDWKNAGIGAAKVVLGVATVAAGVTGGPAGANGVQQLGSGLDQALGGLGVGNVGLSQTGAPPQASTTHGSAATNGCPCATCTSRRRDGADCGTPPLVPPQSDTAGAFVSPSPPFACRRQRAPSAAGALRASNDRGRSRDSLRHHQTCPERQRILSGRQTSGAFPQVSRGWSR